MSAGAVIFVTYLWHYLVARLIYDDLLRPLAHSRHLVIAAGIAGAAAAGFVLGRRRR